MPDPIADAIIDTLIYADLFDYALTPDQIFRYLIGVRASRQDVEGALNDHARLNGSVLRFGVYLALPHRASNVIARERWRADAQKKMPRARFYARVLAHFPFVRMIALTGGLAMENARDGDMDFFVVAAPGRLWFVRGIAVALVHAAHRFGDNLCPNFLVTENALVMREQNLYTAHEVAQMIPLYGLPVFKRMRELNAWIETFLPNAAIAHPLTETSLGRVSAFVKRMAERALGGRIGNRIEQWEMTRKVRKLAAQIPACADGVEFSADVCRGFFSGHGNRVLKEFYARIESNTKLQMTNDKWKLTRR